MTRNGSRAIGRPRKHGELLDQRHQVKLTETLKKRLEKRFEETGIPIATQIRRAIERDFDVFNGETDLYPAVAVYGYIPAGKPDMVYPLPEGATVRPPFRLNPDCYALIVVGDSMTALNGLSIPDGSYAFFCPDAQAVYGSIVHAEFPRSDGEHDCTLKKYCPQPDGTVVFEPLNRKHQPITKREGEYEIKGVFARAWSGNR